MKVLVALSGGVDSAVAAAMLVEEGHEVVAATMKLWGGATDTGCCSVGDVEDARRCAAQLGIDHHVFNFTEDFERDVVEPYVAEHLAGRTPNPCIECNRHLKFASFLDRARLLGFDAVATGHHARVVADADGRRRIARGVDRAKDQSYVLHPIAGAALAGILMPVGHITKAEVRDRAAALGLRSAGKPDSQDVCFVTRGEGRTGFISRRGDLHPGRVVDERGRHVGTVPAVELVTVGQRRGLSLGGGSGRRFVTEVDVAGRTVKVAPRDALLVREVHLEDLRWTHEARSGPLEAQVSAHGSSAPAHLEVGGGSGGMIRWERPRPRVAPGQSVVLYSGDLVVGGGIAG